VNHEEQYSIWPADRELQSGWRNAGFSGTREACTAHIDEIVTNTRPQSLRQKMEKETVKSFV
jgi:MbtH protein